jgi:hypothetical protein
VSHFCIKVLSVLFVLVLLASNIPTVALGQTASNIRFHWEDSFTPAEQKKLVRWLTETQAALEALVGPLPMTTHLYMHRARADEPVPWANTERSSRQGVHFHVDPSHSLEAFREDWTAPHELSHLIIPYVGRNNSWFAEGFASYMQYQVMNAMGVLDEASMNDRYLRNFQRAERAYKHPQRPFAKAAARLRAERKYSTMYWGGAAFFQQIDQHLKRAERSGLIALLRNYVDCCRRNRVNLDGLAKQLDRIAGTDAFKRGLTRFRTEPGFPDYREYQG